jgi:acetylglutamate kinase
MDKKTQNSQGHSASQAKILSQALPFMRRYSGQTIVVKYGGHAMGDTNLAQSFANDIVLLKQVGIHPIVVHGGGPQIGETLERMKIKSSFVDGLRITDSETVDVVEMVLAGTINKQVSAAINEAGGFAVGLSGKDGHLIRASKIRRKKKDPDSNIEKVLDMGFVGEPEEINTHVLNVFKQSDMIPVIAPIGFGPEGETFNINADTAAGAIAAAIGAKRFLLLTDVPGVLDENKTLIENINFAEASNLLDEKIIAGGMIPKVTTCLEAIKNGVDAAVILDGRVAHAILLELFTDQGVGTLITLK